ncbi:MAG: hypothetical protein ACI92I_000281 [Acidimicrobiales bacterium]|jgi:hypothetical protein
MRNTFLLFFFILNISFFAFPGEGTAQFGNPIDPSSASTLVFSPRYPEPNEQITIELNDYSINTSGAAIQWFIDGTEEVLVQNERSISITAGELGSKTIVTAITTLANGSRIEAQKNITPIRIDMLIEADTLAPSFYKGRTIPSTGSSIQVTALPFTGVDRNPETFSYVWRVDDKVQGGGSRYGRNSITFTSGFEKNILVSVDVIDDAGNILSSESTYIPLANPELHFYEINPLRGMSEIAMNNGFIFLGDEIKIHAVPYFVDKSLVTNNPHIEWKLNNQTIQNPSTNPQEITLRKEGDSGSFAIEFHIRNLRQLLQGVKDSVTINF